MAGKVKELIKSYESKVISKKQFVTKVESVLARHQALLAEFKSSILESDAVIFLLNFIRRVWSQSVLR